MFDAADIKSATVALLVEAITRVGHNAVFQASAGGELKALVSRALTAIDRDHSEAIYASISSTTRAEP